MRASVITSALEADDIEKPTVWRLEFGTNAILLIAAFVALCMVLIRSNSGIDLTDESFYLHWMSNPWKYPVSISQFGFLYHPLYKIADGDIALIRRINYLLTFGLAWISCMAVFCRSSSNWRSNSQSILALSAISAVFALSALLVTCFELPQSPSYNTLAFQALMIGVTGLVLAGSAEYSKKLFGYALVGISWWLAFMAKPPTAVALGLTGLLHLLVSGTLRMRLIAVSVIVAALLFLTSAFIIDGSVPLFIQRYALSIESLRIFEAGHSVASIWRWESFPLSGRNLHLLLFSSAIVAFSITLSSLECKRTLRIAVLFATAALAVAGIAISTDNYQLQSPLWRFDGLQIAAAPIGCFVAATLLKRLRHTRLGDFSLVVCLLLLPYFYAVGTNRPYWLNVQGAAFFWVLAGVVIAPEAKGKSPAWRTLLPVCGTVLIMTSLFIHSIMEHPQRQSQPLRLNSDIVEVGREGHQLLLSQDFAEYFRGLRQLAHAGEFKAGTPVIDTTGHSPGAVYAIDGIPPGVPWILGGYKGTDALALFALNLVSCDEIAQAWVITEPSGIASFSGSVIKKNGIDLEQDYQDLGAVMTPTTPFPVSYEQHLLKPLRPLEEAKSACEQKRREAPGAAQ